MPLQIKGLSVIHRLFRIGVLLFAVFLGACDNTAQSDRQTPAAERGPVETFQVGVTSDLVNLPWVVANQQGLLDPVARRHGIRLEFIEFSGEPSALQAYDRGQVDALTMNLNALINGAKSSRHETHIPLLFGFSRGGHGIFSRDVKSIDALKGKKVHLPLHSSGHYLLFRMLERNQLSMGTLRLIDTPQTDLTEGFINGRINTLVASGSTFGRISQLDDAHLVGDSRSLYGEIMAGLMIDSKTLDATPALATTLVEGWFVAMDAFFPDGGPLASEYAGRFARLSNLPADRVSRHLAAHNFLKTPPYALRYMAGDNLGLAIQGAQRFGLATDTYRCGPSSDGACMVERDGDVISDGQGTRIRLDTRFLRKLMEGQ
jgi:ABC-type nitrate/sulfonate/bicarbonate transport system substrate-binding protein